MAPAWAPDGRTLYYRSQADSLVATRLDLQGSRPRVVSRANLFTTADYQWDSVDRAYTVLPDGSGFLFIRQPPDAEFAVFTDWFTEVRTVFDVDD